VRLAMPSVTLLRMISGSLTSVAALHMLLVFLKALTMLLAAIHDLQLVHRDASKTMGLMFAKSTRDATTLACGHTFLGTHII
jgi:hypothetical protein